MNPLRPNTQVLVQHELRCLSMIRTVGKYMYAAKQKPGPYQHAFPDEPQTAVGGLCLGA